MALRRVEGEEATEIILKIIRDAGKPLTTREVQAETDKLRVRCPDSTVVFLNRLRINGVINGERSKEKRGWIWWVES